MATEARVPEAAAPGGLSGRLDAWIDAHARRLVLLLVALGLLLRLAAGRHSFLIADELLHERIAGEPGLRAVVAASLEQAHPPLFFLLLHFWKGIVGSGWALCLLPIAFGTLFLWAAWRWMDRLFGRGAGLLALALLALMPQLVLLTAELRGYSLLLCLAAASLAALERGLDEASPRWIAIAALLAALMMETHYAAVRVVGAMFLYGALRIAAARGPSPVAWTWGIGQAVLGGLFLLQYRWQVSHLRGGTLEHEAQSDWLKASYFRPAEEGLLAFLGRQTAAVFDFLFLTRGAAVPAFLLALLGIAWLAARRSPAAVLLLAPFLIAAAGGVLRIYPYSGSRHSIDLALFAAAAIAFALSRLSGPRLWPVLFLAAALLPGALAVVW
jgi:uncharacterized membrane protein